MGQLFCASASGKERQLRKPPKQCGMADAGLFTAAPYSPSPWSLSPGASKMSSPQAPREGVKVPKLESWGQEGREGGMLRKEGCSGRVPVPAECPLAERETAASL